MTIIELLIWFYAAMVATVFVHEIGHQGKRINIVKWFPWVEGASIEAKYQYGGLIVNFTMGFLVFMLKPDNLFLQLFGFMNWLHFSLYTIFGSFNYEPKVPPRLWKYFVFDDVPNKYFFIAIPLGILNFFLFKSYYVPLIINILKQVNLG